jgi:hypothetical protein
MKLAHQAHPSGSKTKTKHLKILAWQAMNSENQAQDSALGDGSQRQLLAGELLGERRLGA